MSNVEDMFGRIMAHAFSDELEKIALSKDLLRRAADQASEEARAILKGTPEFGSGFDSLPFSRARWRREDQASRFLLRAASPKSLTPKMGDRGSAENLRAVKRQLGMPLVKAKY